MQAATHTETEQKQTTESPTACLFVGRFANPDGADADPSQTLFDRLRAVPACHVEVCDSLEAAREMVEHSTFDLVVLDCATLASVDRAAVVADWMPHAAVAVVGSSDQRDDLVQFVRDGAVTFACAPYDEAQLATALYQAALARHFAVECARLQGVRNTANFDEFVIGRCPAMRRLDATIRRASEIDSTVLIEGHAGTGKSLVARALHDNGRRSDGPLVILQCSSVSEEVLERALADAASGTLVLEDVEQLNPAVQSKVVHVLKLRASHEANPTEPRLIATTSARLPELTASGRFREDLFFRLNQLPMQLPLLRERTEDIAILAQVFLRQAGELSGHSSAGFSPAAIALLESNPWEGNVAQLRNVVFRAHAASGSELVDVPHLAGSVRGVQAPSGVAGASPAAQAQSADAVHDSPVSEAEILPFVEEEKRILTRALKAAEGNVRRAAEMLGIGRATLYRKIQIFELRLS